MTIKKNNKGFGAYELLLMALVCLVLTAIVWAYALKTGYEEKYQVLRYNAKILAINTIRVQNDEKKSVISLLELINEGYFTNIKNPFIGDKYCNIYESKVTFDDSKRYTTLRCGTYLIYNQDIGETKYKIYQITKEWQTKKLTGKNVDTKIAYNYQKDNHLVYDQYYDDEVFLYMFNKKNNTDYKSITDIPSKYSIVKKRFFQDKRLIIEIK